ncbi:putative metalloprotease CJM1_0395 family protein [Chitinivorax sp. B]|uniref:putative metalloprotease CJM1_0395 family protein n=1 Tax=Chitinivorax sp. B TaxID=2502235 RepID=UPI0014850A7A|nr:putative metalloprotease CJM1_0395 family protein [Chitinivorax sp. B]
MPVTSSRGDTNSPGDKTVRQEQVDQINLNRLQQRDREVRAHELAHIAASGGLARGGASYVYQRGPDGQNYAIGGEVSIDVSPGNTPEETIEKARLVRAAALAPSDPSPQDRAIAAQANQMEIQARAEQAQLRAAETEVSRSLNGDDNPAIRGYTQEARQSVFDLTA